jgi:rhodanese-related sulfurtransferase
VSAKRRRQSGTSGQAISPAGPNRIDIPAQPAAYRQMDRRAQIGVLIVALILVTVVVIGADFVLGAISGQGAAPSAAPSASPTPFGVVVPGKGGHWTNVSPDELATMLEHKDFTLLNVKTPYSSEIDRTDLYIPYNQLTARSSELPPDKGAKILVYCLTGHTSAIAAQTLLDLGYTNVWNLDGGMNAWVASGRQLVDRGRK